MFKLFNYVFEFQNLAGNAFSGFAIGPLTLSAFAVLGSSLLEIDEEVDSSVACWVRPDHGDR